MGCSLEQEDRLRTSGCTAIAGVDEAGRGPLAGSVVAAAVILPPDYSLAGLDDSKKLTAAKRLRFRNEIIADTRITWALGSASIEEIDHLNILRATHEAMRRAVQALSQHPDHALIDGLPVHPFPIAQTALVGGDHISLSIAAASVLAKVFRDEEMLEWDRLFPQYHFAAHKGYGTALHLSKLQEYGPCPAHRKSFSPVAQAYLSFSQ